jgi:hypothetical protein
MTIVLMILKIIGWILLILLLLILVLLLLVLFVPVRYRASAKMQEQLQARVRASWLFPVVSFGMEYAEAGIVGRLRIVGIPVMKFPKPKEEAEDSESESEASNECEAETETSEKRENESVVDSAPEEGLSEKTNKNADENLTAESKSQDNSKITSEANEELNPQEDLENTPEVNGDSDSQSNVDSGEDQNNDSAEDSSPEPPKKKRVSIVQKVRDIFVKISDILKNIREWIEKIKKLISDEKNQAAFSHLKQELVYLLKKSVPRKMHVQATFSTGSPDTTGEVLGVIAMFPAAYKNRWNIAPDFEADHFYVEGEAELSGRIFIYQLAGIILRILKDRNCRRLFKKLKG